MYQIISSTHGIEVQRGYDVCDILVEGEGDLARLKDVRPGSIAHTAGMKMMWEKGIDGTWTRIGA